MKRSLSLAFSLAVLASCGVTPTRIQEPINNIGLAYDFPNNKLCHRYTGLTVWGNFRETYELPSDFREMVKSTFREVSEERNIELEFISPGTITEQGQEFYHRSTWDNSAKILPEHLAKFRQIAQARELDTVFVVARDPHTGFRKDCEAVVNYSPEGGLVAFPPIVYAFSAEGALARIIYSSVREQSLPTPHDPKVLDEEFLEALLQAIRSRLQSELTQYIDTRK